MKDLLKMYSYESVHGSEQEKELADWIGKWLEKHGVEYSRAGNNIYQLEKEGRPILSAHLDQVQTNGRAVHFYQDDQGHIRGYNEKYEQTSLGGDDKNGVWIILKLLEDGITDINFIISAGEESGCIGIKALERTGVLKSISPSQFCIVLDRRGNKDVLDSGSGGSYCKTLAQDICNYLGDMSVTSGSLSDTSTICAYCESVNMSVAYEAPHTAAEHTDYNRLLAIKEYVKKLVTDFVHYSTSPSVYKKVTTTTTYYGTSRRTSSKLFKDDIDDDTSYQEYYNKYYGGCYGGY